MRSLQRKLPHGRSGLYKQPSMLHLHYLPGPHLADLAHCSPPVFAAGWPGTLKIADAAAWPEGQLPGHQYSVPTAVASSRSTPFVVGCATAAYSPVSLTLSSALNLRKQLPDHCVHYCGVVSCIQCPFKYYSKTLWLAP